MQVFNKHGGVWYAVTGWACQRKQEAVGSVLWLVAVVQFVTSDKERRKEVCGQGDMHITKEREYVCDNMLIMWERGFWQTPAFFLTNQCELASLRMLKTDWSCLLQEKKKVTVEHYIIGVS